MARDERAADLQGLRALALLALLLSAPALKLLPGGFIGIDIFYVLSGYLITRMLTSEADKFGEIQLRDFYGRRARRLAPAATLVLIVASLAAWLTYPTISHDELGWDTITGALHVLNLQYALDPTLANASPIANYWALALEAQSYWIWPLVIIIGGGIWRGRSIYLKTRQLTIVIATLSIVSLTLAIAFSGTAWTYYLPPARLWELGAGAMLALHPTITEKLGPLAGRIGAYLGITLIASSAILITDPATYPGIWALLPVAGTLLVIAASIEHDGTSTPLLTNPVLGFLGNNSYSTYLWYWPLTVIPTIALARELPASVGIALTLVAIGLGYLTTRYIETPIRYNGELELSPSRSISIGGILMLAGALIGTLMVLVPNPLGGDNPGRPPFALPTPIETTPATAAPTPSASPRPTSSPTQLPTTAPTSSAAATTLPGTSATDILNNAYATTTVPSNLNPTLAGATSDTPQSYRDGCHLGEPATKWSNCTYGNPNGKNGTVMLIGDQQAAQWLAAFDATAKNDNMKLTSLTKENCAVTTAPQTTSVGAPYPACGTTQTTWLTRVAEAKPRLVIIGNTAPDSSLDPAAMSAWYTGMSTMIKKMQAAGAKQIVVLGNTPKYPQSIPDCLTANPTNVPNCTGNRGNTIDTTSENQFSATARTSGATYQQTTNWLCGTDGCPVILGNTLMYRDRTLLTNTFATTLSAIIKNQLVHPTLKAAAASATPSTSTSPAATPAPTTSATPAPTTSASPSTTGQPATSPSTPTASATSSR